MRIKKILTTTLLALLLIACQQKESHSLSAISTLTMNRILTFIDTQQDVLQYYTLNNDVYQINENVIIEEVEAVILKPYALAYLFAIPGAGQKLGLTDCQDPFVMVQSDKELLQKALTTFTDEELIEGYEKALVEEVEYLKENR